MALDVIFTEVVAGFVECEMTDQRFSEAGRGPGENDIILVNPFDFIQPDIFDIQPQNLANAVTAALLDRLVVYRHASDPALEGAAADLDMDLFCVCTGPYYLAH